jgi:hypothetical protein
MIRYNPGDLLKKIAPKKTVKRLLTQKFTVNKAVLNMIAEIDFIGKRDLMDVALKTASQYKKRYKKEKKAGATNTEAKEGTLNDKKLIIHRVQNAVVHQIAQEIRDEYAGEYYKWLPSDADEPDPQHQLNYGKTFRIGDGEMPGDRYGCRCAMEILVKGDKLEL